MPEPLSEQEKVSMTKQQQKYIERWENVARVLRGLSPHERRKHWDMDTFAEKTDCGTVCCAAGHCAFDPWFRKRGWKAVDNGAGWYVVEGLDIDEFFGSKGSSEIFHNRGQRPVGQVIREVKAHIKYLRAGGTP